MRWLISIDFRHGLQNFKSRTYTFMVEHNILTIMLHTLQV